MADSRPKLEDILLLLTIPKIGPGRVRRLLAILGSTEAIFNAPLKRICQIDGIDSIIARQVKTGADKKLVEHQLNRMDKENIGCLTIWDEAYPQLLKKTADPPVILFYKGELPGIWPNCIGVVGTRMPSHYGRAATEKLVTGLVDAGLAVVSGLARGIDTIAHSAAIKRGGSTYAVLGCGVDYIYPPENRKLYMDIQKQGAILSEYFIGTKPDGVNFPKRNRIISGMCLGALIVEAGKKSGALITANYSLEQNREVFAIPGNITNSKSWGPNRLIQLGAKSVLSVEDILEEIAPKLTTGQPTEKPLPPDLGDLEKTLLEHLSSEPKHIDMLVYELKESPAMVLARLLTLELLGLIRQLSGKMFIRI